MKPTKQLNSFYYNGELYIRVVPSKSLFKSTMVHEVVNRGDVFAIRASDQTLTIVPGRAKVLHVEVAIYSGLTDGTQGELF